MATADRLLSTVHPAARRSLTALLGSATTATAFPAAAAALPHRADGIADVAAKDGVIVAVGPDLPRDGAAEIFDATGLLVTPGLVDTHVHVYDSMVPLGIDADRHCLGRGCTTVVGCCCSAFIMSSIWPGVMPGAAICSSQPPVDLSTRG